MRAPYSHGSDSSDGGSDSPYSFMEIDDLLAGAGYQVRSSDLRHVAQSLEQLESSMLSAGVASDAIHYNPSNLAAWVDSMLSPSHSAPDPYPITDTWTDPICLSHPHQHHHTAVIVEPRMPEEDAGIRLVHLLMTCADSVQRGNSGMASSLIDEMRLLLTRVNAGFGIGKVAGYFIDALAKRLYSPPHYAEVGSGSPRSAAEDEILYHHFYEASPYLKFAHFTANQAILEAFNGCDRVHIIDFSLMHGLQWPALIQALALRPGGPPSLRLTGVGPPSADGRDSLREVGIRLAALARSVHVPFTFRGIAAAQLDDVHPWMLHLAPEEAVGVNSIMQLHRLLGDHRGPIESVLGWIRRLRPKIVTVVEQEADNNKPALLDRFTEALFYYSAMFDSLDGGKGGVGAAVAEAYLQREICNIVCCEGAARVERHEPLARWRGRLGRAGMKPVQLGSNAFRQASMLLTLFSGEGYCIEEVDGCLTLGWHNRPLISASAWRADDYLTLPPPVTSYPSS